MELSNIEREGIILYLLALYPDAERLDTLSLEIFDMFIYWKGDSLIQVFDDDFQTSYVNKWRRSDTVQSFIQRITK